ncbi:hypothetical protein ABGT15_06975 [Flavobacterium enshiense]|uniref:hypothetical protein n=1 Tax=Flavobacterium enshiense TaxID=1341165 RepID=UPI00345C91A8
MYFSLSGIWLFINSYTTDRFDYLDHYAAVSENLALLLPLAIVYLFNKRNRSNAFLRSVVVVVAIAVGFYTIHLLIKDNSLNSLVFVLENKNIVSNALLQIVYNIILMVLFILGIRKIELSGGSELFDGIYRKVFILLFLVYYAQDILYFLMVIFSVTSKQQFYWLYIVSLTSNLLVSLLIITLAVYTNWLSLFNKITAEPKLETISLPKENIPVFHFDKEGFRARTWMEFKNVLFNDYPDLIDHIEKLEFLSKTEKLYAGMLPFELSHKEVADLLNVSLRTVETNFYRLRTKLKEYNHALAYPYEAIDL